MAKKSEFGSNWWAQRWIAALEAMGWDTRLQRGRTYARAGRVLEINVGKGEITAKVKGSRPQPYKVLIKLSPLGDADWDKALRVMAEQALFAAKLLSGQMPQNIEEVFAEAKIALFPTARRDLVTSCSCPDWANPCKHIAAVYYLLGSEFDRDPFLLFWLRGRTKEETIAALRAFRSTEDAADQTSDASAAAPSAHEAIPPLDPDPARFWALSDDSAAVAITISPPRVPGAVLKRLGPPPLGDSATAVLKSLAEMYRMVSQIALDLAYDDEEESKVNTGE